MKTFLLACLILGFASAENGQCAPHGASTPALRTAMDAAMSANEKFEALRAEHKKWSNKKLPPSVKKRKLGKLGTQVDDQYDVRQVHVAAVMKAYDVNDGSIDHRSIGINFDMVRQCVVGGRGVGDSLRLRTLMGRSGERRRRAERVGAVGSRRARWVQIGQGGPGGGALVGRLARGAEEDGWGE